VTLVPLPRMLLRIPLLLSLLAAGTMYIALKLNEEVIEQAITDALDSAVLENSQPVPAEAYIYAPRLAFIMPPIAVFALVFVLSGIATCLLDASKRTTPVAMGQPVYVPRRSKHGATGYARAATTTESAAQRAAVHAFQLPNCTSVSWACATHALPWSPSSWPRGC